MHQSIKIPNGVLDILHPSSEIPNDAPACAPPPKVSEHPCKIDSSLDPIGQEKDLEITQELLPIYQWLSGITSRVLTYTMSQPNWM